MQVAVTVEVEHSTEINKIQSKSSCFPLCSSDCFVGPLFVGQS